MGGIEAAGIGLPGGVVGEGAGALAICCGGVIAVVFALGPDNTTTRIVLPRVR